MNVNDEEFRALEESDNLTIGQEEVQRLEEAKEIYSIRLRPKPVFTKPTFWEENWLETLSLMLSAAGTIIISAMRVGVILFIAELSLTELYASVSDVNQWLGTILSIAPTIALFAGFFGFEAYLFSSGLRKGKESGRVEVSVWGIVVSYAVTISSGLLSSLALVGDENWFYQIMLWLVVASTGAGAPILAYFGAFNIGVVRNSYGAKVEESYEKHLEEVEKWEKSFSSWYARYAQKIWDVDRSTSTRASKSMPHDDGVDIKQAVSDYLESRNLLPTQVGVKPGDVLSPKNISDALGYSDSGSVRTALHRLRNEMTN